MIPFFVQIKCQLGKSYEVANKLADAEIASEIYSTAGEFDLLVKFYIDEGTDIGHFVNEKVQTIPGIQDTRTIITLPEELRRSLTWDQGAEMAQHSRLKIDAGIQVYFCDPRSPWQRGTNENTNGLLRQYFPKGTDLSIHSADEISAVAAALNARPRKTLGWKTPAEALDERLS